MRLFAALTPTHRKLKSMRQLNSNNVTFFSYQIGFMNTWAHFCGQLQTLGIVLSKFSNPLWIVLMRLGLVRCPYFLYRMNTRSGQYSLLARPATTSMADLFVLKEVLVHEVYGEILPFLGQNPLRIVDIGGNIGAFVIWLNRHRPGGEYWVFEPMTQSRQLLEFNLVENNVENVHVIAGAAGGKARRVKMQLNESSPGGSSLYSTARDSAASEEVEVFSFSNWLDSKEDDFDLLKLDCEGAEWEILRETSVQQLRRFRAVVAEVHSDSDSCANVELFRTTFEKAGFTTKRWDGHSHGIYLGLRQ
jgi:FkbM family methyltransferase